MCDPELDGNQLCISTPCRTIEGFIATFDRYVTEDSIFVSIVATGPLGHETPFVILLADGAPVLRGMCIVQEVWTTPDGPFGLPGVRLGITRLSPRSLAVFQQMQATSKTLPPSRPPPEEESVLEPLSPALAPGVTRRPLARMVTTRQYFSPLPRASSPPPEQAPMADDADESPFAEPTRVNPASTYELLTSTRKRPPADGLTDNALPGDVEYRLREASTPSSHGPPARTSSRWVSAAWLLAGITIAGLSSAAEPSALTPPTIEAAPAVMHATTEPVESPPPPADAACQVRVASTPTGARVAFDGEVRGSAPLEIDASCGQHRIEISHPGYVTTTTWAALAAGRPELIDVPLARPIHSLLVGTLPKGATIYIDGSPAGVTPKRLNVLGHVPMTLEIKKAGYRPVTEHLVSTTPRDWLGIRLTREPPTARRLAKR